MTIANVNLLSIGHSIVKGTRHVPRPTSQLTVDGVTGDRRFCLIDPDTHSVLRTINYRSLMGVETWCEGDALTTVFPDGDSISGDVRGTGKAVESEYWGRPMELEVVDAVHTEKFADFLGRPVLLAQRPVGGVVFDGPLSIVATASLEELGRRADHRDLVSEAARFRANLLIETDEPFIEETWQGHDVLISGHTVRIGKPIARCALIDADPATGEAAGNLLKTLIDSGRRNAQGKPIFAVYGTLLPSDSDVGSGV